MKEWNCSLKDTVKFFLTLVTLAYVATGCGNIKHVAIIEVEFRPYVLKFEQLARDNGMESDFSVTVDISFKTLPDGTLGKCFSATQSALAYIIINPAYWNSFTNESKEQLIFHELGHCELGRVHNSKITRDSNNEMIPNSIMNPMIFNDTTFEKYYANYVHELFKQGEF